MLYTEAKEQGLVKDLIPVHINKCRCENYFWDWSSGIEDWVRGEKIPEQLNKMYRNPKEKSDYLK